MVKSYKLRRNRNKDNKSDNLSDIDDAEVRYIIMHSLLLVDLEIVNKGLTSVYISKWKHLPCT